MGGSSAPHIQAGTDLDSAWAVRQCMARARADRARSARPLDSAQERNTRLAETTGMYGASRLRTTLLDNRAPQGAGARSSFMGACSRRSWSAALNKICSLIPDARSLERKASQAARWGTSDEISKQPAFSLFASPRFRNRQYNI